MRTVLPRVEAARDIESAVAYYVAEGGLRLGLRFAGELEFAFDHLAAHPASGSPRYASLLDLPGLRSWQLKHFPYLIFYHADAQVIDVWRVLHAQRDIPSSLQEE